jgi:hypothetical protein
MANFVWGAGGARMTPEEIAAEKKVAAALMMQGMDYSPVQHWSQGAARVAQALMGGLDWRMADEAGKRNAAADKELLAGLIGGGGGVPASPAPASAAPAPANRSVGPIASTSNKVYENNEPSPLDPPSGAERDLLIRTVLAEAGNQGPTGMQAVANVVRNRAVNGNFGGDTVSGVIQKPYQFEPWNTPQGRARMAAIDPNSPQYSAAEEAVARAYAGDDPTRGATHFYAPKAQAALGRPAPSWDNGTGVDIKDHRFFGGAGTPAVTAGASPTEVSAQNRQPVPAAPQPAAGPNTAALVSALTNPAASDATKKVATLLLAQRFKQDETPASVREYEYGLKNPAFAQRQIDLRAASRPQVTVDQRSENKFAEESAKLFAKKYDELSSQAANAQQMLGMYDVAEQALASGVRTGFGAEAELDLRRMAQSMGIGDADKIAGGELIRAIQNRMALTMRSPDGGMGMPGALSDRDIKFLKDSQIGIDRSEEGNRRMLKAFRAMENRKIQLSQLADEYIQRNGKLDAGFNREVREWAKNNPLFTPDMFAPRKPQGQRSIDDLLKQYGAPQ